MVAAQIMKSASISGRSVRELLGPHDLTMADATRILGGAIGKPDLPYVQFSYDDAADAMSGMGMPEKTVETMIEM